MRVIPPTHTTHRGKMLYNSKAQICWDVNRIFIGYGSVYATNLLALADNVANRLLEIARVTSMHWRWFRRSGVQHALHVIQNMMRRLRNYYAIDDDYADHARSLFALVWRQVGPQLTKQLRAMRARARLRLAPFLRRRLVRYILARRELNRIIIDGTAAAAAGTSSNNNLLLQLLSAPPVGIDGRRDIHDAAHTVHAFLGI